MNEAKATIKPQMRWQWTEQFIPDGTLVVMNIWWVSAERVVSGSFKNSHFRSMSRDVQDPEYFNPDRHLETDVPKPHEYIYGCGRRWECLSQPDDQMRPLKTCPIQCRICPGRFFADNLIFLMTSNILAHFNIAQTSTCRPNLANPSHVQFSRGLTRYISYIAMRHRYW